MTAWWWSQLFALLAMVADIAAFQFRERTPILLALNVAGASLGARRSPGQRRVQQRSCLSAKHFYGSVAH